MKLRHEIYMIVSILAVLFMLSTVSAFSGSGAGTSASPFLITSWEQLNETKDNLTASYLLVNSLDQNSAGWVTYNGDRGWNSTSNFAGTFDGNYNTISDFRIRHLTQPNKALFHQVQSTGVIKNVGFINASITCDRICGAVAGHLFQGTIENTYVIDSLINTTASLNGESGALAGAMNGGLINNSYSRNTSIKINQRRAGGILGEMVSGEIANTYSANTIINKSSNIDIVGGIVGRYTAGTSTNTFWDNQTWNVSTTIFGVGNTTVNMKNQNAYINFDFTNTWIISAGQNDGYARLQNQKNSSFFFDATFTTPVTEGSSQEFILNITLNESQSVSNVIMQYNGTNYTSSLVTIGSMATATNTINIPSVSAQENVNFFYYVFYTASPTLLTGTYQQTINDLPLDDCSVYTNIIINMSMYNETDLVRLGASDNPVIDIDMDIYNTQRTILISSYSKEFTTHTGSVCTNLDMTNNTFSMDAVIQYTSNGRFEEFYHIERFTLNATTDNITQPLYNLNNTIGQEFTIVYKNDNFAVVPNALIQINRRYLNLGETKVVEIVKNGGDGTTVGHFVVDDVIYRLNVLVNGLIVASFDNVLAQCQNPTFNDCEININAFTSNVDVTDFIDGDDMATLISFNSDTRDVSAVFTIPSGVNGLVSLNVSLYDNYGNESICSKQVNAVSGTLTCNVPDNFGNVTVVANVYKDGGRQAVGILSLAQDPESIYQTNLVFIALIMIVLFIGMSISDNPMKTLLFGSLGFIVLLILNIIYTPSWIGGGALALWLAVGLIIVLIKGGNR